ncbi:hypothetical protein [uncultured Albimonas sp.]|uniref:hypothetical protein n=1 Tax=uncultured Albimonas sp. TaxID=1331701 RepID=UPI0030EF6983
MRLRRRLAILALAAAVPALSAQAQQAQQAQQAAPETGAETDATERGWRDLFFDPQDGAPDLSGLLARGGFVPAPVLITEPAVDGGLGLVGYFVQMRGADRPPERTILGAAVTGNGSNGYGALHSGSFLGGDLLYSAAAAHGLAILNLYPGGRDYSLAYDNTITYVGGRAHYRLGGGAVSVGPSVSWRSNDVAADLSGLFPRRDPLLGRTTDLLALGGSLHYDDRDNPLTPTSGVNAIAEALTYSAALGSDRDFSSLTMTAAGFESRGEWTAGALISLAATFGDAPFFMEPGVDLRGVSYGRYTGDRVASLEVELRRQVSDRWAVLGFAGVGHAQRSGSILSGSEATVPAGGVGLRYRIARKLGLDMGLDLAFGEEGSTVYIQFGHAWGRSMD